MSHFYHRSRIAKRNNNKNKNKKLFLIDSLAYVSAIIGPFMTLPQLYGIWVQKNVAGVSVISWSGFAFFNMIFIIYGIMNKEKLIIMNNSIWFIVQVFVVIGILINS